MRRSGYLIAAVVLAALAVALWYVVLSPGWIGRTGWERTEFERSE